LRLVEQTQVVLREIEALKNMASSSYHQSLSQTLDIGIIPTLAPYMFSHMNAVCQNFPEIELEIHEAQTNQLLNMLESDAIKCAIMTSNKDTSKYVELPLFDEPLMLGVSHQHPWRVLMILIWGI
jgi:LysR family hydrogen peroxide-inducible transcriptional activator